MLIFILYTPGGPLPGGSSLDIHSDIYELVQFNLSYLKPMNRLSKPRKVQIAQNVAHALQNPKESI